MAMVAEDRKVSVILQQLLSGEIALVLAPSELFVKPTDVAPFYTLQKRSQRLNMVRLFPGLKPLRPPYQISS
jgi:hypothetical protein